MTVNELMEVLSALQQNGCGKHVVIKSSDDEGNSYQTISEIQETQCLKYRNSTDVHLIADEDVPDYENAKNFINVICIW